MTIKINNVEAIPLKIPFSIGNKIPKSGGLEWPALEILLIKVESSDGIVGWGEAFSYSSQHTAFAAFNTMIKPLIMKREITSIPNFLRELQQILHLFGRYGVVMHCFSGLDIALYDIESKQKKLPLHKHLNLNSEKSKLEGYASLYRYADCDIIKEKCLESLKNGYKFIKLHEITEEHVRAAREAIGEKIPLMVDTNCPWDYDTALDIGKKLEQYNLLWLEEPIFPPEDFETLFKLRSNIKTPIAAGENCYTIYQFYQMVNNKAVDYIQPSVTKVGGISEFVKIKKLAIKNELKVMPHSPYFGPGWLATLHLITAFWPSALVERLYVYEEASLYKDSVVPKNGTFSVTDNFGLGLDPNQDVIKTYKVKY